ncbi:hypothetical protein [Desulfosarcina sp.]|uniref:hypothetical protein n=1 Tax=Desulfosarcina sp. TaxID=2027861 RepID=UPI003970C871
MEQAAIQAHNQPAQEPGPVKTATGSRRKIIGSAAQRMRAQGAKSFAIKTVSIDLMTDSW